jgi:hypothetical protein
MAAEGAWYLRDVAPVDPIDLYSGEVLRSPPQSGSAVNIRRASPMVYRYAPQPTPPLVVEVELTFFDGSTTIQKITTSDDVVIGGDKPVVHVKIQVLGYVSDLC